MPKYVFLDGHTFFGTDFGIQTGILRSFGVDVVIAECKRDEDIVKAAASADVVGLNCSRIQGALMDSLKKCRALVRCGTGYDSIAVDDATRRGIAVCNIPDYCQSDVATHTLAMILDLSRKVTLLDRKFREGVWNNNYGYRVRRLSSLKLGLVGFGRVARKLVEYVRPYGMEIFAFSPRESASTFSESGVRPLAFDELLAESDIISLHCPLTSETRYMVSRESIAKMKDGVFIVNTSRGAVICLDDLVSALKSGKVGAAALDVIEGEPDIPSGHPIFGFENVILNPHSAFNSLDSEKELHEKVARTVIEILEGKLPYNCVNKEALINNQRNKVSP